MNDRPYSRRTFLKLSTAAAAGLSISAAPNHRDMPHRILGRTGEAVSLLGLGGAHMSDHGNMEEKAAIALMHAAIDEGINFFDNAWGYSDGASEIRMGKALSGGHRDRVFLMTKDASRHPKRAIAHLEESLRRLQTDVIDLWQFHSIRQPDDPERIYEQGLLEAALKAKEAGKIRYIGFTGHTLPALHVEMIERGFAWDATQMPINVFDPHYLSFVEQVLPVAVEKNIGVIAMKTLAGSPGAILATGAATAAECLRYAMSLPVTTVCSGMDSLEKLRQNADIARQFAPLEDEERLALLSRTKEQGAQGTHESYKAHQP